MTQPNLEYNKELKLAHEFIQEQYQKYLHNNKLKSNEERLAYAHAVQIIGHIAYNTNITDKKTTNTSQAEFYNTPLEQ